MAGAARERSGGPWPASWRSTSTRRSSTWRRSPAFEEAFGDVGARAEWFARLLHGSLVATATGAFEDFRTLAGRALDLVATRRARRISERDRDRILGSMTTLPAYPEVPAAWTRLRSAGFSMAALTNSTERTARAQLEHARLIDRFDLVLSVEAVARCGEPPEVVGADLDAVADQILRVSAPAA